MTKDTAHEAFRRALEAAEEAASCVRVDDLEGEQFGAIECCSRICDAIRAIPNTYPASEWVKVSEPELFAKARRLDALEEAMRDAESFLGSEQNSATATVAYIRDIAGRIEKERNEWSGIKHDSDEGWTLSFKQEEEVERHARQLELENADLTAKLAAAQRDAERYSYWRISTMLHLQIDGINDARGTDEFDAAIDAAIREEAA